MLNMREDMQLATLAKKVTPWRKNQKRNENHANMHKTEKNAPE